MKMMHHLPALACATLLVTASALHAQVPNLISYQGKVSIGSTNFTGTGQFKFALVDGSGSTTYWSNDGTSTAGSQPTASVALSVTNGLYSLRLGDIVLPNMTAVPASAFANSDLRVRVWFNDGTHGFQLTTPDQRIAAVGYAFTSGSLNMPATTGLTTGVIMQDGMPFLHSYGTFNFFAGSAGNFTTTGVFNTAVGRNSLSSNTTGWGNTCEGHNSLMANSTGYGNVAIGENALNSNTTGSINTASGVNTLLNNTIGSANMALGSNALTSNTSGNVNTASGSSSLTSNTSGSGNVAVGSSALEFNTTGSNNIAVGSSAGMNLTTGSGNIDIGNPGIAGESDVIRIGTPGTQTDTYLTGVIHGNGSGLTGISASQVSGLMSSPSIRTVGVVYQAATDGFLIGYTSRFHNNNGFRIYCDTNVSPTTVAQEGYSLWVSGGGDVSVPINYPIRKGCYYYIRGLDVSRNEDNSGISLLQFVSFGQ